MVGICGDEVVSQQRPLPFTTEVQVVTWIGQVLAFLQVQEDFWLI